MTQRTPSRHAKTLCIKKFPKGVWRVAWLGDVGLHIAERNFSQLSYAITLVDPASHKQFDVALPVSMMALTPIGSTWRDGVRDDDDWQLTKVFSVVTAKTRCVKAGIAEDSDRTNRFLLPFTHYRGHANHTGSWLLQCDTEQGLILIPALEIVRFYFGSSGSLLMRLFSQPFDGRRLWTEARKDAVSGRVHMTLDAGLSGASAADIARIAFSAEAETVAFNIWRSLISGHSSQQAAYPKLRLPFAGQSFMRARGVVVSEVGQVDRFVVHELLQCSHPFPFTRLTYTAESATPRSSTAPTASASPPTTESARALGTRVTPDSALGDEEPKKRDQATELQAPADVKFVDLTNKVVSRVTPETDEVVRIVGTQIVAELATGRGVAGADSRRSEPVVEDTGYHPVAIKRPLYCPNPLWAEFFSMIEAFSRISPALQVSFVPLDSRQVHAHLSKLPTIVDDDGVCVDGTLLSGAEFLPNANKLRQRRACVVMFTVGHRVAYATALEPVRAYRASETLLFANATATALDRSSLIKVIVSQVTGASPPPGLVAQKLTLYQRPADEVSLLICVLNLW